MHESDPICTDTLARLLTQRYSKLIPNIKILTKNWVADEVWVCLLHLASWLNFDQYLELLILRSHFAHTRLLQFKPSRWITFSYPCHDLWWKAAGMELFPDCGTQYQPLAIFNKVQLLLEGTSVFPSSFPYHQTPDMSAGSDLLPALSVNILRHKLVPLLQSTDVASLLLVCKSWRESVALAIDTISLPTIPTYFPCTFRNITSVNLQNSTHPFHSPTPPSNNSIQPLATLPYLHHLFTEQFSAHMLQQLQSLTNLTKLSINLLDVSLPDLAASLHPLLHLQALQLSLSSTSVTKSSISALVTALPPATTIDLQMTVVNDAYLSATLNCLHQGSRVTSLELLGVSQKRLYLDCAVLQSLGRLHQLTHLNLSGHTVTNLAFLTALTNLMSVNLNKVVLEDASLGFDYQLQWLLNILPGLTSLEAAASRNVAPEHSLAASVPMLQRLHTLNLSSWPLDCQQMFPALGKLPGLRQLVLNDTVFAGGFDHINCLTQLEHLSLASALFYFETDAERTTVGRSLACLTNLTHLDLSHSCWMRNGVWYSGGLLHFGLHTYLPALKKLQYLDASLDTVFQHYGNVPSKVLRKVIPSLVNIRTLKMPSTFTCNPMNMATRCVLATYSSAVVEYLKGNPEGHVFFKNRRFPQPPVGDSCHGDVVYEGDWVFNSLGVPIQRPYRTNLIAQSSIITDW